MANEQAPQLDPNQPIDSAAEGLTPHQQLTAELMAAAEGMDGLAVPTVEQFDRARELAQELKPTGQGFYANGKRVENQAAAEAMEFTGDPKRWELDKDQEAQWRSVANAKHVADLSEDMRTYVGKVDIHEPSSSVLSRARQEANARLALHDHLKAEEAARQAKAAEAQALEEQAAAEQRVVDMDKERQRVYEEERARAMTKAARDIEVKLDKIMAERVDLSSPEAKRLAASTREKFRAQVERDALVEANARAAAAADAREQYINENGGIDNLDKINFRDKMGPGSGKAKAGENVSDFRVNDNRSEEAKARSWSKDLGVSYSDWHNASKEEKDEILARAAVAKAQAEANAATADNEPEPDLEDKPDDNSDKTTVKDDAEKTERQPKTEGGLTDDEVVGAIAEDGMRGKLNREHAREVIRRVMERWRAEQAAPAAAEAAPAGGDDDGERGPNGTGVLPVVDTTPQGLHARLIRMAERLRGHYTDEARGRRRRVRDALIGAGVLVGAGVGIFLASRGMGGLETAFAGPIPGFSGSKSGNHNETIQRAHEQYRSMREGSNPWEVAKQYLISRGNKHPSNSQIEAEDGRIGRLYMAAHHLGQYSWNVWSKLSTKLPGGRYRVR